MEKQKTKISRSWGATFGFLGGALILFVVSILLSATIIEGPITVGLALIPAVAAVALLFMAFGGSGKSSCPICNHSLSGLSTKANDGVLCTSCHNYLEGKTVCSGRQIRIELLMTQSSLHRCPSVSFFRGAAVCVVEKKLVWNQLVSRPKMHPRQSRLQSLE